jgi:hypothetical protein
MLRRTRTKPKFKMLVRRLGGTEYRAVGVLEIVWHVTAENEQTRDGAIGRFSDEEIETAIGWDGNPGELVRALVETGWLDEVAEEHGRLFVHDWDEWSDEYTQAELAKDRRFFANGKPPQKFHGVRGQDRNEVRRWYEEHSSQDRPETSQDPHGSGSGQRADKNSTAGTSRRPGVRSEDDDAFEEFKAVYPRRDGDQRWADAKRAWRARLRGDSKRDIPSSTPAEMIEGARCYAAWVRERAKEGTEFVKQAATFLGPDCPFREQWGTNGNGAGAAPRDPAGVHRRLDEGTQRTSRAATQLAGRVARPGRDGREGTRRGRAPRVGGPHRRAGS